MSGSSSTMSTRLHMAGASFQPPPPPAPPAPSALPPQRPPRVDPEGLGELLRLVGVQPVLPVERRCDVHRVLGADGLAEVVVGKALGLPCLSDRLERCCSVHTPPPFSVCGRDCAPRARSPPRPALADAG